MTCTYSVQRSCKSTQPSISNAIEYVAILGDYLHQPHIDWLRADNINLDTGLLAGDTTGTVLQFFSDLLAEALYYSNPTAFG